MADYQAPTITDAGDLSVLTQGGAVGGTLDADFSAGTERGDLTFS